MDERTLGKAVKDIYRVYSLSLSVHSTGSTRSMKEIDIMSHMSPSCSIPHILDVCLLDSL